MKEKHNMEIKKLTVQIEKYRQLVEQFKGLILKVHPYRVECDRVKIDHIIPVDTKNRYFGLIELKAVSEQELLIINKGLLEISIAGWKLVSHRQNHSLTLPEKAVLLPFKHIAITLVPEPHQDKVNILEGVGVIEWHLDAWLPDDFALILFDKDGLLVADLHHLCGNTVSGTAENGFNTFLDPNNID